MWRTSAAGSHGAADAALTSRAVRHATGAVRGVVMLALAALGGCAFERYAAAPLEPAAIEAGRTEARLDDPAGAALLARYGRDAPWPPVAWHPAELGALAAWRSPAVRAARARVAEREAERVVAGQAPNPRLSVSLAYDDERDPGDDSNWTVGPAFSFTVSPYPKRPIRAAAADADIVAARSEVLAAAWRARRAAAGAALALRERTLAHARLEEKAARVAAAVTAARARAAAGVDDGFEWQMLRLEANTLRLERLDGVARAAEAGAALAATLALAPGALGALVVDPSAREIVLPAREDVLRSALASHPRIAAALAAYDRAERELELAVAEQYPDLELTPGYVFDQGDNVWSLAGALVVPLFASHDAAIERARAARAQARAAFEAVQTEVAGEVELAWQRFVAARTALEGARAIASEVAAARRELAAQREQGVADALALARAAIRETTVLERVDALAARAEYAAFELEFAAGAALFDPVFDALLRDLYDGRLYDAPMTAPVRPSP